MKTRSFTSCLALAFLSLNLVNAADVEYSVVVFPGDQPVSVIAGDQAYSLTATEVPNLFKGVAPYSAQYQYSTGDIRESTIRSLAEGTTATGNEFFNRTKTVHVIPELPQAFHPIYHPLMSPMNKSDEIATIILQANATGLAQILAEPLVEFDYTLVSSMHYISNKEVYSFSEAGIKNSGQSSKGFAKQSFKIKLNEFKLVGTKELLYGRNTIKLRAHETDPTFVREKLMIDCLAAAGAATVSGSWARLYINGEPYGLFLMIDDSTTPFIDAVLHGGNRKYQYTGITYKGNAIDPLNEGNLVYINDSALAYPDDIYKVEDLGNLKKADVAVTGEKTPLIEFMRALSLIDPTTMVDQASAAPFENLMDPVHTMIHLAFSFISGSWDGLWYQASNYYLNQDLNSKKWTLMSYDFDETFGIGAAAYLATTPYTNYTRAGSQRPLVDAIIKSPYYAPQFEQVLATIIKRFFKPSIITPRLEAWANLLREDVEWDLSIPFKSPGMQADWTIWNFDNNMLLADGESMGVAQWITERSSSLATQLGITDVDDLPPLGPYLNGVQWNADDYETTNENGDNTKSGASKFTIATGAIALGVIACASQLLL
ncbi:coth protein-domain-containing protein [Pilobolus umbonatus]|nr:coth protein-domain-containing protein [Pilobolus umbonatus]